MLSTFARLSRRVVQSSRRLAVASFSSSHGRSGYAGNTLAFASVSLATLTAIASCIDHDQDSNHGRHDAMLSRNFVADAASIASPSVVNIICPQGGIYGSVTAGSGFIISKDGFIATNAHVVGNAANREVVVTTWDQKKFVGKVYAVDRMSDIAVIKLDEVNEELPCVSFGVSSKVRAGEFVVALGSPLQLQNTVTFGIVSTPARHSTELGIMKRGAEYIQTDAAINVGNSGGPLINLDGEVIGINTMKAQGIDGVSFAIPSDAAAQIIHQLIENKRVIRPYVGMSLVTFVPDASPKRGYFGGWRREDPPDLKKSLTSLSQATVLVQSIAPNSPAEKAGIERGDMIVAIAGKRVTSTRDVLEAIGMDVGKTMEMRIKKGDGKEKVVYLTTSPEKSVLE